MRTAGRHVCRIRCARQMCEVPRAWLANPLLTHTVQPAAARAVHVRTGTRRPCGGVGRSRRGARARTVVGPAARRGVSYIRVQKYKYQVAGCTSLHTSVPHVPRLNRINLRSCKSYCHTVLFSLFDTVPNILSLVSSGVQRVSVWFCQIQFREAIYDERSSACTPACDRLRARWWRC